LDAPRKWSLPAVFGLHQRTRRALDTVFGLEKAVEELRSAELFLREHCVAEPVALAETRLLLGCALNRQGNYSSGQSWIERALGQLPESEAGLRMVAMNARALAMHHQGEVTAAERVLNELEQLARKNGTPHELIRILTNKATLLAEQGKIAETLSLRLEAVVLSPLVHDVALHVRMLVNLALDQMVAGDRVGAERVLRQTDGIGIAAEDCLTRASLHTLQAVVGLSRGHVNEALAACTAGLTLLRDVPGGDAAARLRLKAAVAHNRLGQAEQAAPLAEAAARFYGSGVCGRSWHEALIEQVRSVLGTGNFVQAEALLAELISAEYENLPKDLACSVARLRADLAEEKGELAETIGWLRKADVYGDEWVASTACSVGSASPVLHLPEPGPNADLSSLNEALRQKNAELEWLHHEKRELLTIIAHDLRNQLGATVNYAELALLTENPDVGGLREQMQTIFSITRSTSELLEHLLSLERIESGQVPVVPEPIDLQGWAKHLLERTANVGRAKSIESELLAPPEPIILEVDETWLRLAVENLVTNAYKYSPHGSRISLRLASTENLVTIEVADEGPGIPVEERANLFTKFHRTRNQPTGSEFSTGLGLYLVRQYAELLGCSVGFRPREPRGSVFSLAFEIG